jgi:hypothetical protein
MEPDFIKANIELADALLERDERIRLLEQLVGEYLLDIETGAAALACTPLKTEEGTTVRQLALNDLRVRADRLRSALGKEGGQ